MQIMPISNDAPFKSASVQAAPVFLNRKATVDKACDLIAAARREGARLMCWENYMPLARYSMYAWGVQIYVAATWDRGEPWLSTLRHVAKEGRVFVLGACIALRKDDIPDHYAFKQKFYAHAGEWINVGDSAIVNLEGEFVAGPVRMKEEVLDA